ncbi:hypothetical protein [Sphingobacterium sp.]|uniref:hypothetical protein n=1 Tax=Sphingobacterium sp. TaxID=341027 RepID=UPI0028AE8CF2|nr:hypothetical protein [Sphingobacterium sp.]
MVYEIKRGNTIIWSGLASGKQYKKIMQEDRLDIMVQTPAPIIFKKGDTIVAYGQTYKLNRPENISKVSSKLGYTYMIEFEALYYDLGKWTLLTLDRTNVLSDPSVYLMGDATSILGLLIQNANRASSGWSLGTVENTDVFQWAYSGAKLLTVLQDIADRTNLEFWFEGKVLNLTRRQPQTGLVLEYGKGKGLYELMRQRRDMPIVTNLRILGGSQNIPNGYGYRNIQPLGGNPIVNPHYSGDTDTIEDIMTFDNIYPRLIAKVTATPDENIIRSSDIDFDLNDHLLDDGSSAQIAFTSGLLNGFRFTVSKEGYVHATGQVTFNRIVDDGAYPEGVPNNLLKPAVGDSFVFLNIDMPQSYVTTAETRLRELANEYFADEGTDQYDWSGKITPKFILENDIELMLGGVVRLKAADIGYDGNIRIDSFVRDLQEEYLYDFTLNNIVSINSLIREKNRSDILANTVSKGISSDGLSTKATYAERAGYATMAGHSETSTNAATANFANTAQHAFNADRADRADHALDSDRWNGLLRPDYIDQPVRTTDSVKFLKVTSQTVNATQSVTTDLLTALSKVDTKILNATEEVSTKQLDADNANVTFHINTDTLTAETQIDTNILNALLQINTKVLNASERVNTDILQADSQVSTALVRSEIVRTGEVSSESFVSGFPGLGYRLAKDANGNYMLELDRLTVRKDFTVYELIVSQIRATNGSLWVSDSTKIKTVTSVGAEFECKIDTDGDTIWIPFQQGDIVRCQRFNGRSMKYYTARVVSINTNEKSFRLSIIEGASIPERGDDIVRIGSQSDPNRQGAVYLTASDNGAPFIDVLDGVNYASLAGKTKVRMGKLDGIIDPSLGQLSGYGLYANAAYIKGKFIVEAGSNVYTKNENDSKVSTAKSEAISASAIDSQNKANQAQANAIASANQFSLDAVKAITIGNRNLLSNSNVLIQKLENENLYLLGSYTIIQQKRPLEVGKKYTLVVKGSSNGVGRLGVWVNGQQEIKRDIINNETDVIKFITFTVANTPTRTAISFYHYPSGSTGTSSVEWATLYEGEINRPALDWTPAPEDIKDNLEVFRTQTTTRFEVLDTAIQSKVSQSDYNALNQRVGTAESTIIQYANQIQSKVAQTQFDTLNNTVGGLSGRVSSAESTITQQAGLIATKVTQSQVDVSLNTALGTIKVGGRNYITNSAAEWSTPGMSSYSAYGVYRTNLNDLFENLLGKPLMISFDAKVDLINGATSGAIRVYSSNGNAKYIYSSVIPGVTKDWVRYEAPINLVSTSNTGAGKIEFYGEGANANLVKIYIRNLKLEVGTKATDWSPAPEDVDGELSGLKSRVSTAETSITQNADAIALRATKTEVTTAQNTAIATSKSYTDNSISVTNNAIALKADRTVTDALNSRLNNAELKITPTAIISTVKGATETIVNEAVNNLQVGATNIFYDSFLKAPQMWGTTLGTMASTSFAVGNSVRFNKTSTDAGAFGYQRNSGTQSFSVVNGEEYTLSFDIRGNIGYLNYVFLMRNEAGQANQQLHSELNRLELTGINSTTYIRASTTFRSTFTNDLASILLALSVGVTFWFEIKDIKVEKGNKATDWSPNPSEVESRMVSAESSIIQQAGLIASKVSQTEVNSTVNNAVNGMTLSNRNILLKSNVPFKKLSTDNIYQIGNYQVAPSYRLLPPNKVYTLVVKGSNSGGGSLGVWVDGSQGIKQDLISNESNVIKTIVFTRDSRPNIGGGIYFYHYPQGSAGESSVEWACLYEGNITKPNLEWLPAPEDTDNSNVVVGGRNLIYGGFENGSWNQGSVGQGQDAKMGRTKNVFDLSVGSEYTFSMKEGTVVTINRVWITFRNADNTYNNVLIKNEIPFTFVAPAPKCTITFDAGYYTAALGGQIFEQREPKLEIGNKATGWTQAPEDIKSEFSSLNTTVTSHNTLITQNTTAINLRATKSEVTTQVNNAMNEAINEVTEVKNTRDTNETPAWYFTNHKSKTVREFKFMNVIGLTGVAGTFCQLSTNVPWTDATGGAVVQIATVDNRSFTRYGTTTTWSSWTESENTWGAQNKATTAQANAKTYTDSQITIVNNAITLKSDKTVTDGLTARMTSAETKITPDAIKSTVRAETLQIASDAVTSIQVGGRNLLLNSNAGGSYFGGYSGATVTRTINTVSVPEWGASDATRVVSSGGTSTIRVITALGTPKTGETITISGWFKNNGTTPFVVASNQGARASRMEPGESRRVVFEGIEGNGVGSVQFQINPTLISNNVDFTWWRLQYEFGNKVTDWKPSPDDVENKVTALTTRVTNAETSITQTNNAIALKADKTVTDGLTNRISSAEAKITPGQINLTVKDQTQAIANNASALSLSNGKMLYTDPSFAIGGNGIAIYPSSTGTVMTRQTNITDAPTVEKTGYKFVHTGLSDDGYRCALFSFRNNSRANATFITRIIAKLPVGWRIADAHNAFGTGGNRKQEWLTPTDGTGKWEEYLLKIVCGETGSFSTINHFDLRRINTSYPNPTPSSPIESYVVWATVYDMSDVQNTPTESEIKAGICITSNAINIFGQSLSLAGKVTFSSLDSSTQGTINTASSNASAAVGTANSANSTAGAANSKADSAIGSANTASSNASNALSTANTANSNASAALSTANTANSNATNAKSKTDAWSYASTTEIDGAKLRTGTVTADKINTDNLIARQIKTSEDSSRASLNEGNDGQFKVRHSNGQVAIQMGLVGGVPKIVFYDSSGNKVWEGGTAGIVYVNDVPESWTTGNLFFMDSIASATETLTTTKINTFKNKIKVNSSGSVTNRQMNAGTNFYLYSEGINAISGTNRQYAGYHTNQVKSVTNFIDNGWYVFGSSTLFSDGPGTGTYSATVFKVFNGVVQDDYVIINGIS